MAFSREDTNGFHKRFWRAADLGNGMSEWIYVTTDTAATAEAPDYFLEAIDELNLGDVIRLYQVTALTDGGSAQEAMVAGITDYTLHMVVIKTATSIDVTPDLLAAGAQTYTT